MVTPDAPVKVEKKAQTSVVATTSPPGIQPKSALNNLTSRSEARLSAKINPARVNSGIAGIEGEVTSR